MVKVFVVFKLQFHGLLSEHVFVLQINVFDDLVLAMLIILVGLLNGAKLLFKFVDGLLEDFLAF